MPDPPSAPDITIGRDPATGEYSGTLGFESSAGRSYRITTSTDLVTFVPIATDISGTGDLIEFDLAGYLPGAASRARFFRIEESP